MTTLRVRPTAETFPLDDLVEYARKGQVRVPAFQRGLRWTRRDVTLLFDSILNGYPIGSLLLWERRAPAETVVLGPLSISAGEGEAFFVVDGQQRVTALACALTEEGHQKQFAVGYDLELEAFTPAPTQPSETWIPTYVLYDLSALLVWFRDRPQLTQHFEVAASVSKTLRDLKIPAYVVRHDDGAVLRAIFDRMNNAGKKLTRGEVFAALHRADDSAEQSTVTDVAESIEERTGFGVMSESLVMKLVLARRGPDVMREIRNEFDSNAKGRDDFAVREDRQEAYVRTADAAARAIDFLQASAGVPHQALLPYEHLLVVLVRFFSHHPKPSARHRVLLRRFFWRAVVAGPALTRGDTTGTGRLLNRAVDPDDELGSVQALLASLPEVSTAALPVDPFRTNSAATKVLLGAMWSEGPRSLSSGEVVLDEELRGVLGDQHTALEVVVPVVTGRRAEGVRASAGNRLLLVSPVDRESDVIEALLAADEEALSSHMLTCEDVVSFAAGEAARVVARRVERLEGLQAGFLRRMCEWEQEDTPDMQLLLARDGLDDDA